MTALAAAGAVKERFSQCRVANQDGFGIELNPAVCGVPAALHEGVHGCHILIRYGGEGRHTRARTSNLQKRAEPPAAICRAEESGADQAGTLRATRVGPMAEAARPAKDSLSALHLRGGGRRSWRCHAISAGGALGYRITGEAESASRRGKSAPMAKFQHFKVPRWVCSARQIARGPAPAATARARRPGPRSQDLPRRRMPPSRRSPAGCGGR